MGPSAGRLAAALLLAAAAARGEECPPCPPPPPAGWSISAGGGLSLTGGNSDTSSYNLTGNATHDPRRKNVFRGEFLYLRASDDGQALVDRTLLDLRDEYAVGGRTFVFGRLAFQRDRFKRVDALLAPMLGAGVKAVDRPTLLVALDAGGGGAFEKLAGSETTADLALSAGERIEWRPAAATTIFQKAGGLWKADDFGDAYYRLELGVATSLAKRLELKLAFADDYKTRVASAGLAKHDTSLIASLLLKF